jgi:hypothetical protein
MTLLESDLGLVAPCHPVILIVRRIPIIGSDNPGTITVTPTIISQQGCLAAIAQSKIAPVAITPPEQLPAEVLVPGFLAFLLLLIEARLRHMDFVTPVTTG